MNRNLDLLLDTHVVIALADGVGGAWLDEVRDAFDDPSCSITISAISFAEIAVKHSVGKLAHTCSAIRQAAAASGLTELGFVAGHAEQLGLLPLHHRDPFDRMLIAQAISEEMTLVSADRQFPQYEGLALLQG